MAKEFNCIEHCPDLGHCCRDFSIQIQDRLITKQDTRKEVTEWVEAKKYPFEVLDLNWKSEMWRFACRNLGSDGRCTDYDNRPELCHALQPKRDPFCCVRLTIGELLHDLTFSLVMNIKMIGL